MLQMHIKQPVNEINTLDLTKKKLSFIFPYLILYKNQVTSWWEKS